MDYITTIYTEKAGYLKACGFLVSVFDATNVNEIRWKISGTSKTGITAETAGHLIHDGRIEDLIPEPGIKFYEFYERSVKAVRELHNIINEIKANAKVKA
jgi:hypothetical protein